MINTSVKYWWEIFYFINIKYIFKTAKFINAYSDIAKLLLGETSYYITEFKKYISHVYFMNQV